MTDDSTSRSAEGEESADADETTRRDESSIEDGVETDATPDPDRTDAGDSTSGDPDEHREKAVESADEPTADRATLPGDHTTDATDEPDEEFDGEPRTELDDPSESTGELDERTEGPDDEEPTRPASDERVTDAPDGPSGDPTPSSPNDFVPEDVRKYERFKKMDGARYERVNEFLRDRTYVTAREWAIARLCADFRTETGVEMTKIGENLPRLVPFMNDTYTPQAVNQARHSFEEKVHKSGATFLYGAMSGFFTAEQLDDLMYEITEVAKFLLEVEGVDLSVEEELEAEDRILSVMREVRQQSEQLRHDGVECPECGHEIGAEGDD